MLLKITFFYNKILYMSDIQDRFKEIRNSVGVTQDNFAEKLGVSRSTIAQIERKNNLPTIELIVRIVNIYNISGDWILTGRGEMHIKTNSLEEEGEGLKKENIASNSGFTELEKANLKIEVLEKFLDKILNKINISIKD